MSITREVAFEANIEQAMLADGWRKLAPSGYDRKRGIFPDEVVDFVKESQPKAWASLVKRHGSEAMAVDKFVTTVVKAVEHRGTLDVLRGGVKDSGVPVRLAYFKPPSGLNAEQQKRYEANRCGLVRQLHHSESKPHDSLDLALVVNGLPVATAELKNQFSGQGLAQAMAQYRDDRNPADLIFAGRTLVHFAVDPHQVAMTTRLASAQTRFLPFNQGSNGPGVSGSAGNPPSSGYQTAYLWEQVWQRDNWLDLIGSFIQASGDRVLFPRFHQWHAVRALIDATRRDGAGVDRLVQHSAGSGKSNTIAWTAHALSKLHGADDLPIFDKVVVITDRKVLDKQLQDTVAGLEHTPGVVQRIDQNSGQLRDTLLSNKARIVITTLQKFPVVVELANKAAAEGDTQQIAGKRFAVIVDEAHSSTGGDGVKKLKEVLGSSLEEAEAEQDAAEEAEEANDLLVASAAQRGKQKNLSFFAFTATPKPKTLEIFGQPGPDGFNVPFHTYSMRQAIDEGFILDVLRNYTTYGVYYRLTNTESGADIEVDKGKGRAALARFASLHPYELDAKAEVIVEHFREKTMAKINGRAKAMVVTRSRLHAVRTQAAIEKYITLRGYDQGPRALKSLVAFSGSLTDEDAGVVLTESSVNGFSESQLPRRFREDDLLRFLVVAEKYQTGFDEPLLHTMYVDKKLSGVQAVQTLSRLNRTMPGKEDTFVLDFANSADEVLSAFAPFYERTEATPTEPNILYTLQSDLESAGVLARDEMDAAVTLLLEGDPATQGAMYANVQPATGRYIALASSDEEAAEAFRSSLDSFVRAYAFLAQVMPWSDPSLERLYLYGKLLLADLPARDSDPMPQLSQAVQMTHLRLAVTHEGAVELEASDEPGVALPGEGRGRLTEPEVDKLSALIAAMNEKFGADLGEADKIWVEQQRQIVLDNDELRLVAQNNDQSAYELVLEQLIGQMLLTRHDSNGNLLDMFFEKAGFKQQLINYLATDTYHHFRTADAIEYRN